MARATVDTSSIKPVCRNPVATTATTAAILVLRYSTILAANVFVYTLEPARVTARTVRCIGGLIGIRHKGRSISGMTAFTRGFTGSVIARIFARSTYCA